MPDEPATKRRFGGALAVGTGILLSRIIGLVRDRVIARYLGIQPAADAFRAALRIPNLLQNLLGEGVLSASFIPVYAQLRAEGRTDDARRLACAVGTLLALAASAITLVGELAARPLVDVLAGGFAPEMRELTITLIRILFPGVALLVMSAWCLGVLNSHRRFFLSYASPVLWSMALIGAALLATARLPLGSAAGDAELATWLAWAAVIGSAAQFLIQLPTVVALVRGLRPSLAIGDPNVRTTLHRFVPIVFGRGSAQLSGYIDQTIASYLGPGMVSAMFNAQTLYMLPISLFGMAVSAAELPEMSSALGDDATRAAHLQTRLEGALRRVVFLVVPSALAFIAIGDAIVALIYQNGQFGAGATHVVWIILAGSALGLSAGTQGRLLGSAFYALGDPKPPLRAALVRVAFTGSLGWVFALPLRERLGYTPAWGAFGLTASAGFAAWIEFLLLKRWLAQRIGPVPIPAKLGFGALGAAAIAGAAGFGTQRGVHALVGHTWPGAVAAIAVFGVVYFAIMIAAGVPEATALSRGVLRKLRRKRGA